MIGAFRSSLFRCEVVSREVQLKLFPRRFADVPVSCCFIVNVFSYLQNHSNSCEASCRFLTHMKTFSSIVTGDGSSSPTPGIPTVTSKTLNSVSLEWEPLKNTSGTPVYIIGISYTGDWDKGLFSLPHVCICTQLSTYVYVL